MSAAPGIPSRDDLGDLTKLSPGLVDYAVQQHDATRAGRHFDLRLGSPELGHYSWALRKGIPEAGQKHLAVQQPIHDPSWSSFEGTVPAGNYGAGTVKRHDMGQALVTHVGPEAVHFTIAHRRYPERFALIKPKGNDRNWLMINHTPTQAIPYEKQHYTLVPKEQAESVLGSLQPGSSVQEKIDGAAILATLGKKHVDVNSYRAAKQTGRPIIHTERVFGGRPDIAIPAALRGTILRGELYGTREGQAIPPQELGGILNATIANSLHKQKERNVRLHNLIFDVHQQGRTPIPRTMPYEQRMGIVKEILKHLPQDQFHAPTEAKTPEAALAMWKGIQSGQNPLTAEGVVVHPPEGVPKKIKLRDEHDVHITGFAPGKGKYTDKGIGAFTYSHEPGGKTVGEVGSGMSDELRQEMHRDPAAFIGRIAKVLAQQKLPSGALRAPALLSLHEDLPTKNPA